MEAIRKLAPWQIILIAVVTLVVFLIAAYFIVTRMTTPSQPVVLPPDVAGDLNSDANKKVFKDLSSFQAARVGNLQPQPLRTPDPNNPSLINPFSY